MCNDKHDAERDYHSSMAKGQFHEVTIDVTFRKTLTLPGRDHTTEDIEDALSTIEEWDDLREWDEV